MIMSDGALTMADGGEFGVASEPGAGPGIGEELHIELGVNSVPVVPQSLVPTTILISTSLSHRSWVQHARN